MLKSFYDGSRKLFKLPAPKVTGLSNMLNPTLNSSHHYRKQGFLGFQAVLGGHEALDK